MNLRYSLSFAVVLGLSTSALAQPPCLTSFAAPVGQTQVANINWNPPIVPPTTSVSLNVTTTAGNPVATVTGCNAVLVGAAVSGPNFPVGTTVLSTACTSVTFSQPATVTGSALHTFTLPQYANNYPPQNTGVPANLSCSVCPAVFSVNMCAGQWFTYQMCIGNIYTISMCSAVPSWDSYLAITTVAGTVLATGSPTSDDDGCGTAGGHASLSFVPTATGTYRVRLWQDPCLVNGALCGTIQVACNPVPAPPSNDNPTGATPLPMSTVCNFVSSNNAYATQSTGTTPVTPTACGAGCAASSGNFAGYDVWFSTTVAASGNLSVQTQLVSAANIAMAVYTGVPGALTQVGGPTYCGSCNDDSSPGILNPFITLSGLPPGATVYIRVWSNSGLANMGSFQICAYEPVPPPNDNPCGAINLPVNVSCVSTSFTTENATALAGMTLSPASPTCGNPVAGGDVWFTATMPATGSMTFNSTAGSLTDMAMAVYQLTAGSICSPGTLTEVVGGCNDNFGVSNMPSVTISGAPGGVYYVRMWNKTSTFGTASICAVQNVPPPNDNPCGAIPLAVNTGCIFPAPYSTQFATITAGVPNPSCNGGPYNSDVWFSAVIPASGQLIIDTDDIGLTDGGMAVYTGPCAGPLVQVPVGNGGCVVAGSGNGAAMPMTTITGVPAGTTVYIRIWRQAGNDGTFLICARNPANPSGCYFTLRMADSAGDGWNGGFVTLCVDPAGPPPAVCTNYTVTGALAFITFGAAVTDQVTLSYTPAGGFQNQVSFNLQASNGFNLFVSTSPPATGFNYAFTVDAACNVPAAPISDCIGSFQVCNNQSINIAPGNFGNTQDLNAGNHGCLLTNERQGAWFRFTTNAAGTIAFNINVGVGTDYDFGVWGPFAGAPPCPPPTPPMRCNWSAVTGPTGLNYTAINNTEGAGGPPFSRWIDVVANQTYLLYVDNFTMNGLAFTLVWNNVPNTILDCILPVEFLDFQAFPKARQVDLEWTTASEYNSAYFNVERSENGSEFKVLGTVAAMGNSQSLTEYAFIDREPVKGVNYYRLDQVDANGDRTYSDVVTAVYRWGNVPLTVYPNPAGESLWANFELPADGNIGWRILDASGRVVLSGTSNVAHGVNQISIPLDVEAGSYMLELSDDSGSPIGNARFVRQ